MKAKYLAFLLMATLTMSLVSACGDDDEENASALVGTWQEEYRIDNGTRYDYDKDDKDAEVFIFKSDGTGFEGSDDKNLHPEWYWPITWKYNAGKKQLTVTYAEQSMYWDVYEVTSLTADKMELRWIGDEDGSASSQGIEEYIMGLVKK